MLRTSKEPRTQYADEAPPTAYPAPCHGRTLAVDFVRWLRDTRPFKGADDLVAQLRQDIAQARQVLTVSEQ